MKAMYLVYTFLMYLFFSIKVSTKHLISFYLFYCCVPTKTYYNEVYLSVNLVTHLFAFFFHNLGPNKIENFANSFLVINLHYHLTL